MKNQVTGIYGINCEDIALWWTSIKVSRRTGFISGKKKTHSLLRVFTLSGLITLLAILLMNITWRPGTGMSAVNKSLLCFPKDSTASATLHIHQCFWKWNLYTGTTLSTPRSYYGSFENKRLAVSFARTRTTTSNLMYFFPFWRRPVDPTRPTLNSVNIEKKKEEHFDMSKVSDVEEVLNRSFKGIFRCMV